MARCYACDTLLPINSGSDPKIPNRSYCQKCQEAFEDCLPAEPILPGEVSHLLDPYGFDVVTAQPDEEDFCITYDEEEQS